MNHSLKENINYESPSHVLIKDNISL